MRRGRPRPARLEPQAERLLRHLEDAGVPYAVVTSRDEAELSRDLTALCAFPDVVVPGGAASTASCNSAVRALGARPDTTVALVSTDDAHWAAGQAGLHAVYAPSFDMVPGMLGFESTHPLATLWAALRAPATCAQRRRTLADTFVVSGLRVTSEFTRETRV